MLASTTSAGSARTCPTALRLVLVKADGSVSVHADDRSYKPLNWMSPPCTLRIEPTAPGRQLWTVTNKAGERLLITVEEVLHDSSHELGIDPGLVKDGVEAHLQELLAEQVEHARRRLAAGPAGVPDGRSGRSTCSAGTPTAAAVAVEIKRRGEIDGVEQLTRYLELLNRDPLLAPVRGVFAAQEIKPQARVLAADRGIDCVTLDYEALRGVDDPGSRLFCTGPDECRERRPPWAGLAGLGRDRTATRRSASAGCASSTATVHAVDGIDLDVHRGEIFALLGPERRRARPRPSRSSRATAHRTRRRGRACSARTRPTAARPGGPGSASSCSRPPDIADLTVEEVVRHFAGFYPAPRDPDEVIDVGRARARSGRRGSASCPAASAAASTSRSASSAAPSCCSSTSRPPASTPRPGGSSGT